MLKPYVFVGVGGSGGKTLRYLYMEMERRLRSIGWKDSMPGSWRFLHIDIPEDPDDYAKDVPREIMSGPEEYLGLAKKNVGYGFYDTRLTEHEDLDRAVFGWRPDPSADFAELWKGAKQVRSLGRVINLVGLAEVQEALNGMHADVLSPASAEQLNDLATLIGADCDPSDVQFMVIGSLGGGAGSGMIVDTLEVMKSMAEPTEPIALLYAPEVFNHLEPKSREGIAPNSLAALSELLSGFEHDGPVDQDELGLLTRSGFVGGSPGRRVFLQNFIVGASNEHLRLPDSVAVFRATGKALSAFVMNPDVSDKFGSYLQANLTHTVNLYSHRAAGNEPAPRSIFSAFGYATVGLGRSLFAEYAAERLAAAAIDRLRNGHLRGVSPGAVVNEQAKVRGEVELHLHQFLSTTGLANSGATDLILDSFRNTAETTRLIEERSSSAWAVFINDFGKDKAHNQAQKLNAHWQPYDAALRSDLTAASQGAAVAWCDRLQDVLLDEVARSVGKYGLQVAAGLVEATVAEVTAAAASYRSRASTEDSARTSALSAADGLLRQLGSKTIGPNHGALADTVTQLGESILHRHEAAVLRLAANVLADMVSGLLEPIERAIARAADELEQMLRRAGDGTLAARVSSWPSEVRPAVPPTLFPARNEVLLVPVGDFPDEFARELRVQTEVADENDDEGSLQEGLPEAIEKATAEVVSGSWLRVGSPSQELPRQTLLVQRRRWIPDVDELEALTEVSQQANITMELHPIERLLAGAREWVSGVRGEFGRYVNETLKEHLSPEHPQHYTRNEEFIDRLSQALDLSAPLINVDDATFAEVYASPGSELSYIMSPVPLQPGDESYDAAFDAVRERLGSSAESVFNPATRNQEVEISSFLSAAIGAVPIDSLARSIISEWNRCKESPELRAEFWRFRRARRLPSFIPMSPSRQAAFIRGWFIGQLLGHIPPYQVQWSEQPLTVWTPDGILTFPEHLLGPEPSHELEVPLAILETLPLALMMFGQGGSSALRSIEAVIELGLPGRNPQDLTYRNLGPALQQWLESSGQVEANANSTDGSATLPDEQLAGAADATEAERRAAVTAHLEFWRDDVARIGELSWEELIAADFPTPRVWETAREMSAAFEALIDAISAGRSSSPGRTVGRSRPG